MLIRLLPFVALLLLPSCQSPSPPPDRQQQGQSKPSPTAQYDALRFVDVKMPANGQAAPADVPATLWQEVVLDRLGFSSGVIDGKRTRFDEQALRGFQSAHGLDETGTLDAPTKAALARWQNLSATRLVRIPSAFAAGPFYPDLPKDAADQAKLKQLGYRGIVEALAERFHTTHEMLAKLNGPNAKVGADAILRVPNIADVDPASLDEDVRGWNRTLMSLSIAPAQPSAARIVVDKSEGTLRAFDDAGKLLVQFPATIGSEHDPLPIGEWKILGVSKNPDFHYNPKLFWDVSDNVKAQLLPPGPNGPVGVVWLDLSKEHYGIHGTSEPASIGRSESHGCVRLTNWDAARLAQMVKSGVAVTFQD